MDMVRAARFDERSAGEVGFRCGAVGLGVGEGDPGNGLMVQKRCLGIALAALPAAATVR